MSVRPGNLCKLETGKCIDAHVGFVATFNWLVDFCANLVGDNKKITVDTSTSDKPVVKFIESSDEEEEDGTKTTTISVVTGMHYDSTTHKFFYTTKNVKAILADDTESEVEAFETTPLSGEN